MLDIGNEKRYRGKSCLSAVSSFTGKISANDSKLIIGYIIVRVHALPLSIYLPPQLELRHTSPPSPKPKQTSKRMLYSGRQKDIARKKYITRPLRHQYQADKIIFQKFTYGKCQRKGILHKNLQNNIKKLHYKCDISVPKNLLFISPKLSRVYHFGGGEFSPTLKTYSVCSLLPYSI